MKSILKILGIGILAIIVMFALLSILIPIIGGIIGIILLASVVVGLFIIVKKLL